MEHNFGYSLFPAFPGYGDPFNISGSQKIETTTDASPPSCSNDVSTTPVFEYTRRHDSVGSSRTPSPRSCDDKEDVTPVDQTIAELEKVASAIGNTQSQEKPSHSYVALVSMAILNSKEKRLLLGDIYRYISENFPYYRPDQKAWRNSIRYNLSVNECFIKAGKEENKGFYWAVHPSCESDFMKGDYRRRQPKKRTRRARDRGIAGNVSQKDTVAAAPMYTAPEAAHRPCNLQNPWSLNGGYSVLPTSQDCYMPAMPAVYDMYQQFPYAIYQDGYVPNYQYGASYPESYYTNMTVPAAAPYQ